MSRREPATALVLSFLIPGVGQLYSGRIGWAIFWFIFTPGLWIGSGGMFGWIAHILSALQAQSQAERT
jgi:TM2 domain-containing membrane protein YozV